MNRHRPTVTSIEVLSWWKAREHALRNEWSVDVKAAELGISPAQLRRIIANARARVCHIDRKVRRVMSELRA